MAQELAVVDFNREKVELIKQTVANGASDLELELFFHACKRTGLDPLMKQIYSIPRWDSKLNKYVHTIQTGIDGYRLIADRTGQYAGNDDPLYAPVTETRDNGPISAATVTVWKLVNGQRCGFTATARWNEYCQYTKDGQPTSMWKKMPYCMLAKCAEALALRKAFPAELSGVYTHEEMMQADNEPKVMVEDVATGAPVAAKGASQVSPPVPAEAPTKVSQESLIADWKASLDAATSLSDLQFAMDLARQDTRLYKASCPIIYKHFRQREKELKG